MGKMLQFLNCQSGPKPLCSRTHLIHSWDEREGKFWATAWDYPAEEYIAVIGSIQCTHKLYHNMHSEQLLHLQYHLFLPLAFVTSNNALKGVKLYHAGMWLGLCTIPNKQCTCGCRTSDALTVEMDRPGRLNKDTWLWWFSLAYVQSPSTCLHI